MRLCSFARMMSCMKRVGMSGMCVMSRGLMMTRGVMRGCFLVVLHSLLVMLGGLGMVAMRRMLLMRWFLSHVFSPLLQVFPKHAIYRSVP